MQQVIGDLILALREGGVPVSTSETLDAIRSAELIGIEDRRQLKAALGLSVAKTQESKVRYSHIFEVFFSTLLSAESKADSAEEQVQEQGQEQGAEQAAPNAQERTDSQAELMAASNSNLSDNNETSLSALSQQLIAGDQATLATAMAAAGDAVGVNQMQVFTQQPLMTFRIMQQLGLDDVNADLSALAQDEENAELVQLLQARRNALREQVSDYVQRQFMLFGEGKGQVLREENLQRVNFTSIDHQHYAQMAKLVRKAAKQLARLHSRRRKVTKRGVLDARKTIAANAAFDGALFHTKWKSVRIERPKVIAICDVSGSVSQVARFLLLFLYSLQDVLPRVRSFVFSGEMAEVTERFEKEDMDAAFGYVMQEWANRSTDYGRALEDFERMALRDVDNKTTVIMLGDARNNNGDGQTQIWEKVYRRANRVLWLNPERPGSWDTGDSIMKEYQPYCSRIETCNSLRDLSRILGSLLKHS